MTAPRRTGDPAPRLDPALIRSLPKVELHVHLEGTFDRDTIADMAAAAGTSLPRPVEQLFEFSDLSDFLGFLDWTCTLITTNEHASLAAYRYAERAANDGIVYAEVIVNPTHWPHWPLTDLVDALTAGFDRARAAGLADCGLLLSILRAQSEQEALALVEWIGEQRPRGVVGISIDGDEARAGRTGPRFAPAYRRAVELGIHRTAHAGESSGADGVRDALDLLHVERIDHGIRAVDDPALVAELVARAVPLNVCLTSNLVHLYPDLAHHPVAALIDAGVHVTINTDDPGYLGIDLTGEFTLAAEHLGWDTTDLARLTRSAIDAAFCDDSTRGRLHALVEQWLHSHPHPSPLQEEHP